MIVQVVKLCFRVLLVCMPLFLSLSAGKLFGCCSLRCRGSKLAYMLSFKGKLASVKGNIVVKLCYLLDINYLLDFKGEYMLGQGKFVLKLRYLLGIQWLRFEAKFANLLAFLGCPLFVGKLVLLLEWPAALRCL